jgi:hypothetical protein
MATRKKSVKIQTSEDKIIEQCDLVLKNVNKEKNEESFILEYSKLLGRYKKLSSRLDKMMKINDKQNLSIINDNESLEEDKQNILVYSKKKIMSGISSSREKMNKHTEQITQYTEAIGSLQEQQKEDKEKIFELEKILKNAVQKLGTSNTKVVKLEETTQKLQAKISILKGDTTLFHQVLENQIIASREAKQTLIAGVFGIDNYTSTKGKILEFIAEDKFISAMTKYLQNSTSKNHIIVYFESGVFFIMIKDTTMENTINKFKEIGKRKIVQGNSISFSGCFTHLTQDDNVDSISDRCFENFYDMLERQVSNEVLEA